MNTNNSGRIRIAICQDDVTQRVPELTKLTDFGYEIVSADAQADKAAIDVLIGAPRSLRTFEDLECAKLAMMDLATSTDIEQELGQFHEVLNCVSTSAEMDLRIRTALFRAKRKKIQQQKEVILESKTELVEPADSASLFFDNVTGLPNRVVFLGCINDTAEAAVQQNFRFAVVLLSLNTFYEVTNTIGYQNADTLLARVANRIKRTTKELDFSVVLMRHEQEDLCVASVAPMVFGMQIFIPDQYEINHLLRKILDQLQQPYSFEGLSINIGVQLGAVAFPDYGEDANDVLRLANITLDYVSKNHLDVATYSPDVDPYSSRRLSLMGDLLIAIEKNQLNMHYQPQMRLKDNVITGAEALLRWTHEKHGFIPPDEFIGLAENTGVIKPLTEWVIHSVSHQAMLFTAEGKKMRFSINLSAKNLREDELFAYILDTLMTYQIEPDDIVLEITESAMLQDPQQALTVLQGFSGMGLRISIDDFGTGYSSLGYLSRLPVTEMKIDRSFVRDMATNKDDRVIVTTIIDMAHNLGLEVVAEGVEDKETMDMLREMGCDYMQGYYLAKPMNVDDVKKWLDDKAWTSLL